MTLLETNENLLTIEEGFLSCILERNLSSSHKSEFAINIIFSEIQHNALRLLILPRLSPENGKNDK